MEEAPENDEESSHSAHAKEMYEWMNEVVMLIWTERNSCVVRSPTSSFEGENFEF